MPPLPYAFHAHLAPNPMLRDWLQAQLLRVTLTSLSDLQCRLWLAFPHERLMVPSTDYPTFWLWDQTTDQRTVLLEMFGFERGTTPGLLTSRLRDIGSALRRFDTDERPTTTPFMLQGLVINRVQARQKELELGPNEPLEAELRVNQLVRTFELEPVRTPPPVVEEADESKAVSSVPVSIRRGKSRAVPEKPDKKKSNALSGQTKQCLGVVSHGEQKQQCKFRSTGVTPYCAKHERVLNDAVLVSVPSQAGAELEKSSDHTESGVEDEKSGVGGKTA